MRNLLKRRPRDAAKPTLRERLTATKAKFGHVLAARRAAKGSPVAALAPVDRIALVNYASWLFMERRMVCRELYPHMGTRADKFVLSMNAAERFHFPTCGSYPAGEPTAWKASDRAVSVLDLVGVDWRSDLSDARRGDLDPSAVQDDGKRPAVPHGWPRLDAALLDGLDDLNRLEAAISALAAAGPEDRDLDSIPGFDALADARDEAIDRIGKGQAESLIGLQVKAKALLGHSVSDFGGERARQIGESIARDLLGIEQRAIEPRPDPVLAVIEEAWRLTREHGRLLAISGDKPSDHPSHDPEDDAHNAMWEHVRGVLLKTVPTTAAGCVALARFAVAFTEDQGVPLEYESNDPVLALIARSPLL